MAVCVRHVGYSSPICSVELSWLLCQLTTPSGLFPILHPVYCLCCCESLKSRQCESPNTAFCFGLTSFFACLCKFYHQSVNFYKKVSFLLSLYINFQRTDFLTSWSLPIHELIFSSLFFFLWWYWGLNLALCLLGRCSTTWATLPAMHLVIFT
jgi:hypothetical protein